LLHLVGDLFELQEGVSEQTKNTTKVTQCTEHTAAFHEADKLPLRPVSQLGYTINDRVTDFTQ
jgi:hypothetical protein